MIHRETHMYSASAPVAVLFKVVGVPHTTPLGCPSPFMKPVDDLFYW